MKPILSFLTNRIQKWFLRVSLQEQVMFARHLAIMAKSGMPLLDSLVMLKKQARSKSMRKILDQLAVNISNGQFLSASLEPYRHIFGNLFISIINVGESTGILSENLNYLAEELKKKQELRRKVLGALIYPIIILLATIGITVLLMVVIFPKIMPVFKTLNVPLPFTTRWLIALSNFLAVYGGWMLLAAVAIVVFLAILLRVKPIKYFYHNLILRLPIVGSLAQAVNLANICRTMGLTSKSGIQAVQALFITAETLSNVIYQDNLKKIAEQLTRGEAISESLNRYPVLFPPMVTQMVAVGENTGNLSETFLYLSEFYESEINEFTKNLSNILEPILMIVMGIIVGFIALSIITPIYEVTQTLRR